MIQAGQRLGTDMGGFSVFFEESYVLDAKKDSCQTKVRMTLVSLLLRVAGPSCCFFPLSLMLFTWATAFTPPSLSGPTVGWPNVWRDTDCIGGAAAAPSRCSQVQSESVTASGLWPGLTSRYLEGNLFGVKCYMGFAF